MRRILGFENHQNILDDKLISEALLENGITNLADKEELLLLHDPCDIRKRYSSKSEDLGKVRSLDGDIINGYSSFNSVAIDLHGKNLTLLSSDIYSNRADDQITQKDLKLISKPCSLKASVEKQAYYAAIAAKAAQIEYTNSSIIARTNITKVSRELKTNNPNVKLTHVLDRGFDDNSLFKFITDEIKDDFVIRLKSSRLAETSGSNNHEKLIIKEFDKSVSHYYSKIQIKKKVYQDLRCFVEYGEKIAGYSVVRIQLFTREGKLLFATPMLVITSRAVTTDEQATAIYRIYLKRAKIEGVFKFLKEVLGWEDSQIRDFKAMKTLLTLCYFVAGYFYEIESALIENPTIKFLAELGGGKGKVTKTFVLRGLSKIIIKVMVDDIIEKSDITPEQLKEIMMLAKMGVF